MHREIDARLVEHLAPISLAPGRVLDLGAGTGGLTRALASRFPRARVFGVDWARKRLAIGRAAAPRWRRRHHYLCADAHLLPVASRSVDLVVASGIAHWSNDLAALLRESARVLRPGGLLAYAAFGPDTLNELQACWTQADASARGRAGTPVRVHSFVDMHDHGDALVRGGFGGVVMDAEQVTLTYLDLDALFSDLRHQGETNAAVGRAAGLTHPARLARVRQAYDRLRQPDGRLPATYEFVYAHAWRASGPVKTKIPTLDVRSGPPRA